MNFFINTVIFLGTFAFMEFMAWFTHKYILHCLLWNLHLDQHDRKVKGKRWFERNDTFFLIFAVPSWLCIMYGMMNGSDFRVWVGAGIAVYGATYFIVHDIFIHQRFKILRHTKHPYFMALRRAHQIHHKHQGKLEGECFGMLVVPPKYYREARKNLRKA
ncbi:MAG: carotene hydroxylase [Salibacteraceae bacterium]